jgi:hypothetical protein
MDIEGYRLTFPLLATITISKSADSREYCTPSPLPHKKSKAAVKSMENAIVNSDFVTLI